MGHIGQKSALGLIGCLSGLFGLEQFLFGPHLLADVANESNNPTIINQNQNTVVIGGNNGQGNTGFGVLGGAGLDPTVFKVCTGGSITGDQGYARSVARHYRQYLQKLIALTSGGQNNGTGSIYGETPTTQPSATPSSEPTPYATATSDISVVEKTTIDGNIYDANGHPLTTGKVTVTSLNNSVEFNASTDLVNGTYAFNNIPAGVQLQIEVEVPGAAPRRQTVVAKSNKTGDPNANKYDFGGLDSEGNPDLRTAINAAPEVVQVTPQRNASGVPTNTDYVLRFSEPMDTHSVESNFGVWSATTEFLPGDTALGFAGRRLEQDIGSSKSIEPATFYGVGDDGTDKDTLGDFVNAPYLDPHSGKWRGQTTLVFGPQNFDFTWNADQTELTARLKPGLRLPSADPNDTPDYLVGLFSSDGKILDQSGTERDQEYFKLTEGYHEQYFKFSVTPDSEPFDFEQFFSTQMLGSIQDQYGEPLPPPLKARDDYYFSYDDSASVASVELFKQSLEAGIMPKPDWAKTWEFLNYETFDHIDQEPVGLFDVSMGLWQHPDLNNAKLNTYEVGVHVTAPYLCMATRKRLNLTLLVDVSTSMGEEAPLASLEGGTKPSKLELVQYGLKEIQHQLRAGDKVSLLLFSNKSFTALDQFEVGKSDPADWDKALEQVELMGGTNLQDGVEAAYRQAKKTQEANVLNRVLLMTDAYPTEGNLDLKLLQNMAAEGDQKGIYLSALGIGHSHNQTLLNQITEAGRGAYYTIANKTDMKEAMGDRFIPLMDVIARNVRFNLEFPGWMRHGKSAAEEVSSDPSKVQPTNFSANTSQYFWEEFKSNQGDYQPQDTIKLTISYEDPLSGEQQQKVYEKPVAEILDKDLGNIKAAHLVQLSTALVRKEVSAAEVSAELQQLLPNTGL